MTRTGLGQLDTVRPGGLTSQAPPQQASDEQRKTAGSSAGVEGMPAKYRGLCSTCANAATCTFPRDPNRPVLHCDEFEGHEMPQFAGGMGEVSGPRVGAAEHEAKNKDRDAEQYKGLCRNCAKRKTCAFPKSEVGVWRCEEYE